MMSTETITRTEPGQIERRSLSLTRSPNTKQSSSALDLYGDGHAAHLKEGVSQAAKGGFNGIEGVPRQELTPGRKIDDKEYPWELVQSIDEKDKKTPDEWIPRHPGLIRLTGRYSSQANI